MDKFRENKKYVIFSIILFGILVLAVLLLYHFSLKKKSNSDSVLISSLSALEILSKYSGINYGKTTDLVGNEINSGGSYRLSGEYGCVVVNTTKDVQLILDGASIQCSEGPGIYIEDADVVNIQLNGSNEVISTTVEDLDGGIYSRDDLIFSGSGSLKVSSNYDGIVSKDSLVFESGTYEVLSDDDGIRGKDNVSIVNGKFLITSSGDGIKSTNEEESDKGFIVIDGGDFSIQSMGDGMDAASILYLNDGVYSIVTSGGYQGKTEGDTSSKGLKGDSQVVVKKGDITLNTLDDAIHSNGSVAILDGSLSIQTGDDGIHADDIVQITGGTVEISDCYEGIEGNTVLISSGDISVVASDDGINASSKDSTDTSNNASFDRGGNRGGDHFKNSNGKIIIFSGNIHVVSSGDGIDANGTIDISGGMVTVESSNNAAETALDHDGDLTVTGGTLIGVSRSSGANDIGSRNSSIPMLVANVSSSNGTITLGDITYTPTISDYQFLIIASSKLSSKKYTFVWGDNSEKVELSNGVSTIGNTNSMMGGGMGRGGMPNDRQEPGNGDRPEGEMPDDIPNDGRGPGSNGTPSDNVDGRGSDRGQKRVAKEK